MRCWGEQERPLPSWHLAGHRTNQHPKVAVFAVAFIVITRLLGQLNGVQRHAAGWRHTSQVCGRRIASVCGT